PKLSKDEILYLYLNQIDFPYQRYGVEEAARFYFGKSVSEVDAGEAALLASLPKGPSEIDPWKHPERAKDRQRYVLSQMVRYNHADKAAAQRAAEQPITLVREPTPLYGVAPEFVDEVERHLAEKHGAQELPYLGPDVRPTRGAAVQRAAREALEHNLQKLDERVRVRGALRHLSAA